MKTIRALFALCAVPASAASLLVESLDANGRATPITRLVLDQSGRKTTSSATVESTFFEHAATVAANGTVAETYVAKPHWFGVVIEAESTGDRVRIDLERRTLLRVRHALPFPNCRLIT